MILSLRQWISRLFTVAPPCHGSPSHFHSSAASTAIPWHSPEGALVLGGRGSPK